MSNIMQDDKNLFFIPILAKAYNDPDKSFGFEQAINEIILLGEKSEYQKGFGHFQQFVLSGLQNLTSDIEDLESIRSAVIDKILVSIISDTLEGSKEIKNNFLKRIKADKTLSERFEKLKRQFGFEQEFKIEVYFNNNILETISVKDGSAYLSGIMPGRYILKLSNGRTIWESEILENDLIWQKAFPDQDYQMAAATEDEDKSITRIMDIFDGEITIKLHAGLESGGLSLIINR